MGLQDSYVKQLEWSDARHVKKIEVLEKENEVLPEKEISRRAGSEQQGVRRGPSTSG